MVHGKQAAIFFLLSFKILFQRHESYPYKFYKTLGDHFDGQGEKVEVYIGNINYQDNMEELNKIPKLFEENEFIRQNSIEFWFTNFTMYYESQVEISEQKLAINSSFR